MAKKSDENAEFFLYYCFPVIFGVSFGGYLEHGSIIGWILSIVITSIIVGILLTIFRK